MTKKITVYTRDNCAACIGTKKQFEIRSIPVFEVNVEREEDKSTAQWLVDQGFRQMPVVSVEWDDGEISWWSGTDLAAIKLVAQDIKP